jgi:uncharacterized membrane protein YozB (DUF420 family)
MFSLSNLPTLNACLNATTFLLLLAGFYFIKQKNINAHKACMLSAMAVAVLFLTFYVIYHSQVGSVKFTQQGWIRPVYFTILISHTILAMAIIPLALTTMYRGLKNQLAKHVKIARWTLPIWLYISITGIVIYAMLYHL